MTNYDILKYTIETDPWKIARRLWSCMDCPKLEECNVASRPYKNEKFGWTPIDICKACINEWLNEEIEQ